MHVLSCKECGGCDPVVTDAPGDGSTSLDAQARYCLSHHVIPNSTLLAICISAKSSRICRCRQSKATNKMRTHATRIVVHGNQIPFSCHRSAAEVVTQPLGRELPQALTPRSIGVEDFDIRQRMKMNKF